MPYTNTFDLDLELTLDFVMILHSPCTDAHCQTMPPHFVYNSTSGQPTFYSSTDDLEIRPFSPLRVRVLGTRISADKMSGIASINEDFLGPI